MSYDDIFAATGIVRLRPHHDDRFSYSDLRKLVDYFAENWEPKKDLQEIPVTIKD